jgi:hypothetical protein
MDEAKRGELRRWARGVAEESDNADARAAARAVALLLEEVDRLERELEALRSAVPGDARAPRKRRFPRPPRRGPTVGLLAIVVVSAAVAFGTRALSPDLAAAGPGQGERIGAAGARRLVFSVEASPDTLARVRWRVDGVDVTSRARIFGGRSELRGSSLPDGDHRVEAIVPRQLPHLAAGRSWRVSIDRMPPQVRIDPASAQAARGMPVTLRGTVDPGSQVTADGKVAATEDGFFEVSLPPPPRGPVELVATDLYGNFARTAVRVLLVPRLPAKPTRAVHVTFYGWADRGLRSGVIRLVDEGRIDAVELDLKDESGIVGFDADIPFARRIGSIRAIYDLPQAVELLHRKGVLVIGRIVAFRDPVHAQAAWRHGWKSQVIQAPGGGLYAGYGGFTNFADPVVRQYNIDVARQAAEAGVDDILYDYVRRPDGPIGSMIFPGLDGTPEAAIASFLGDAQSQLADYDVFLGASVFGIAATRPKEIAQPIRAMARNVDYIAPMVYPSHWTPGEYDVADPNAQPYEIVFRALADFRRQTKGTGARVVPWLQDFSLGVAYGPAEVQAQIRAAADRGIDEWLLWDPNVTYTEEALRRTR